MPETTTTSPLIEEHRRGSHWIRSGTWTKPIRAIEITPVGRVGECCPFCEQDHVAFRSGDFLIAQSEDFDPVLRSWIVSATVEGGTREVRVWKPVDLSAREPEPAQVGWSSLGTCLVRDAERYAEMIRIGAQIGRELDSASAKP